MWSCVSCVPPVKAGGRDAWDIFAVERFVSKQAISGPLFSEHAAAHPCYCSTPFSLGFDNV